LTEHVLTLACRDRIGIVHAVTGFLAERGCNILDSQQFGDPDTGRFFMRVHCAASAVSADQLRADFADLGRTFEMDWQLHDSDRRTRSLILVSRSGHCLNDLLYRWQTGALTAEIVGIVSNHPDFEPLARAYGVPYHWLPVTPQERDRQERVLLDLVESYQAELVVLARYMQVLSDDLCDRLSGRMINIHHSFLPSFKGARPYQQAYDRGVKLIGATAHYVTAELDEGPIIDQEVARVDHSHSPAKLEAIGRDLESQALARAVQAHAEHRVLLNGSKTVVFR
jgi:formyltetrahydrofolate deformylase